METRNWVLLSVVSQYTIARFPQRQPHQTQLFPLFSRLPGVALSPLGRQVLNETQLEKSRHTFMRALKRLKRKCLVQVFCHNSINSAQAFQERRPLCQRLLGQQNSYPTLYRGSCCTTMPPTRARSFSLLSRYISSLVSCLGHHAT